VRLPARLAPAALGQRRHGGFDHKVREKLPPALPTDDERIGRATIAKPVGTDRGLGKGRCPEARHGLSGLARLPDRRTPPKLPTRADPPVPDLRSAGPRSARSDRPSKRSTNASRSPSAHGLSFELCATGANGTTGIVRLPLAQCQLYF